MPGPVETFSASFCLAAIAGLMRLLHSDREITARSFSSSLGYSGCVGLIASLGLYQIKPDNAYLIMCVAGLFGATGRDPAIMWEWLKNVLVSSLKNGNGHPQKPTDDDAKG